MFELIPKIVLVALFATMLVVIGHNIGVEKAKRAQECFDACAGIVLLTPDEESVYVELLEKTERCAEELP